MSFFPPAPQGPASVNRVGNVSCIPHPSNSPEPSDGREENHDPNELEWEAALRCHAGTFRQFDSIVSTERVQWAKDHLTEEMKTHAINRKTFEEDREKWAKRNEEVIARHLLVLRKEIVRAWMRIEEESWKKSRETWEKEADTLEWEFNRELSRIKVIPNGPPGQKVPKFESPPLHPSARPPIRSMADKWP